MNRKGPHTQHTCPAGSLYFNTGWNAAERGMSPKERFKTEYHNEQFRWGYFAYVAATEEIFEGATVA